MTHGRPVSVRAIIAIKPITRNNLLEGDVR